MKLKAAVERDSTRMFLKNISQMTKAASSAEKCLVLLHIVIIRSIALEESGRFLWSEIYGSGVDAPLTYETNEDNELRYALRNLLIAVILS